MKIRIWWRFARICGNMNTMELLNRSKIIANFFLDGAKIIFGSLVVGAFAPNALGGRPSLLTIGFGILGTVFFLLIAEAASKRL